jgi:hypothetical protein
MLDVTDDWPAITDDVFSRPEVGDCFDGLRLLPRETEEEEIHSNFIALVTQIAGALVCRVSPANGRKIHVAGRPV